jgi:two-component system OmpR family response regulator
MTDPLHVLIVDDEPRIRNMLRCYLVEEGFKVSDAGDGAGTRAVLAREVIHLVLLDLMMPGEDGLSLARPIRQHSEIPIIMLTGKGDLIDRVVGLETGADDYIPKPFELREVLARIRTVMRRAGPRATPAAPMPASAASGNASKVLVFEEWRLDVLRRELRRQTDWRPRAPHRWRVRAVMRLRPPSQSRAEPRSADRSRRVGRTFECILLAAFCTLLS